MFNECNSSLQQISSVPGYITNSTQQAQQRESNWFTQNDDTRGITVTLKL